MVKINRVNVKRASANKVKTAATLDRDRGGGNRGAGDRGSGDSGPSADRPVEAAVEGVGRAGLTSGGVTGGGVTGGGVTGGGVTGGGVSNGREDPSNLALQDECKNALIEPQQSSQQAHGEQASYDKASNQKDGNEKGADKKNDTEKKEPQAAQRHIIMLDVTPFWPFFWPIYESKRAQMFALACGKFLRDGLAVSHLARLFPFPVFEDVLLELSRPVSVGPNIILVGAASLFVKWDPKRYRGPAPNLVGPGLARRLERLEPLWCFKFCPDVLWTIVNDVTGKKYTPEPLQPTDEKDQEDWGVIRRCLASPFENTWIFEGVHSLGTLGTLMVVTDHRKMLPIVMAIEKLKMLESFSDALPLEILVRTSYQACVTPGVQAPQAIQATPVKIVYNRKWVYDLLGDQRWRNQEPWSQHILASPVEGVLASPTLPPKWETVVPRLEVHLDLTDLPQSDLDLCRKVLSTPGGRFVTRASAAEIDAFFGLLRRISHRVHLELHETASKGGTPLCHVLPDRAYGMKSIRKTYFVELLFGRLLSRPYRFDAASLRQNLPEFARKFPIPAGLSEKERQAVDHALEEAFKGRVNGRMTEGFERLLREGGTTQKEYVDFLIDSIAKTYELELFKLSILFKIRF
ncbi:MAG: hypothetical protein AB1486_00950 [Planctomycetota bacterium]